MIRLSEELELPDDLVTQPCAILARRGAGKTYTASVMTEEMLGQGLPVVVLDPLGVWWGLRSSADGEHSGLPVTILGGDHGDVPLEPTGGRLAAELVVEEPGGWIIDLSLFESQAAQDRFAYDFAERLYRAQRRESAPLHLMVDEAHNFVPQNVTSGRGAGGHGPKMLGAYEVLVRQGRSRGIGCTLISQRPAVINKNVLSQVEVLIAGQVTGKIDRDVLTAWAKGWATKDQLTEFEGSLASLKIGEVWLWSPQWLETFQRVQIRKRTTFDSSATPKAGEVRIEPRVLAPVDLEAVKVRMAATIEKVEASDPKKLQARIRELERDARAHVCPIFAPERIVETVEVPVVDPELLTGLIRVMQFGADHLLAVGAHLREIEDQALPIIEQLQEQLTKSAGAAAGSAPPAQPRRVPAPQTDRSAREPSPRPAGTSVSSPQVREQKRGSADGSLPKAERAFLTVLAQHGPQERARLATLAGYSVKSRHVDNVLGALRSKSYVSTGWPAEITADGRDALGPWDPLPEGAELRAYWLAHERVSAAGRAFLQVLFDRYPDTIHRDDLAEAAGYSPTSRHVDNTLGALRTLGLAVGGRDAIAASDTLYVEGGR